MLLRGRKAWAGATMKETVESMPALFVGHGSPMNAIEDNEFSRGWEAAAQSLPKPKAILCVSAHWESDGCFVTAMDKPKTIHDFYGFPDELNQVQYPAPGSATLAATVRKTVKSATVGADQEWGLDHGTWSVLRRMYPKADIPAVQLSLDRTQGPQSHYDLGKELRVLRRQSILVIGSGNMVHNLRLMEWTEKPFDWATEFDAQLKGLIEKRDHKALINYPALGKSAALAIPPNEHYLPMLYVLGMQEAGEPLRFFNEAVTLGSISTRCFRIG